MEEVRSMNYLEFLKRLTDAKEAIRTTYNELREQILAESKGLLSLEYGKKISEKEKVERIFSFFENFCYISEEILSYLREDVKKIENKVPENFAEILKNYKNSLEGFRPYLRLVLSDPIFELYMNKSDIDEIRKKFISLQKQTKQLITQLCEKNNTLTLLK